MSLYRECWGPPRSFTIPVRRLPEAWSALPSSDRVSCWLADADALLLRRDDRVDPLVVLPWQTWAWLVPGMARPGRGEGRQCAGAPPAALNPAGVWRPSGLHKRPGRHCA
jgi:hypothetical protein